MGSLPEARPGPVRGAGTGLHCGDEQWSLAWFIPRSLQVRFLPPPQPFLHQTHSPRMPRTTVNIKAGEFPQLLQQAETLGKAVIKGHSLSVARNIREIRDLSRDYDVGLRKVGEEFADRNGDNLIVACITEERQSVRVDPDMYLGEWKRGMEVTTGQIVYHQAPATPGQTIYWRYIGDDGEPSAPGTGDVWQKMGFRHPDDQAYQLSNIEGYREAVESYNNVEAEVDLFLLPATALDGVEIAAADVPVVMFEGDDE